MTSSTVGSILDLQSASADAFNMCRPGTLHSMIALEGREHRSEKILAARVHSKTCTQHRLLYFVERDEVAVIATFAQLA